VEKLTRDEQEQCVGRNKITRLLLGTPENDDERSIEALKNDDPIAKDKLRKLIDDQTDPKKLFYDSETYKNNVPAWSHIRKSNPRQEKNTYEKRIEKKIIFRRRYLFMETGLNNRPLLGFFLSPSKETLIIALNL